MKEVKYFTTDGKEVKFGDAVHLHEKKQTRFGTLTREEIITATEESMPYLIKRGSIVPKEVEVKEDNDVLIETLIRKFASHLGCEYEEAIAFLETVYNVNSTSFYNMVFKKLAIEADKAYPNHINKAENLWFISTLTFEVLPLKTKRSVNFKNFAAFRTPEDAKKAIELANIIADHFDEQ